MRIKYYKFTIPMFHQWYESEVRLFGPSRFPSFEYVFSLFVKGELTWEGIPVKLV